MNCFEVLVLFCFIGAAFANVLPAVNQTAVNQTACQEHRERELKSTVAAKLVPECDENGDYIPLACYDGEGGAKFCSCFTKTGAVAKSPSPNVKRCECHLEKHEKENLPGIGAFIPKCEEEGSYSKLQCWGSTGMCWCSHPDGKKKTEPTRDNVTCE